LVLSYADIHHKKQAEDGEDEESKTKEKSKRKRSQSPSHDFEDRLANQREIGNITEKMFENKSKLNFEDFKEFNTNVSSETILCVLKSLKQHIPCTDNFYKYLKKYRSNMDAKSLSPKEQVRSSPIAGSKAKTFKATSPTSAEVKNKSFLFTAARNEKGSKYMRDLVGDDSTKPDSASMTKEEIEEKVASNASKLKNPKVLRKEKLLRQATIKDEEEKEDATVDKKAIRMKNITKLRIDTNLGKDEEFTSEIQSPSRYLEKKEDFKVSKICT